MSIGGLHGLALLFFSFAFHLRDAMLHGVSGLQCMVVFIEIRMGTIRDGGQRHDDIHLTSGI